MRFTSEQEKLLTLCQKLVACLVSDAECRWQETANDTDHDQAPVIAVDTKDSALLIGTHGATLDALQHLFRVLAARRQLPCLVTLDVNGYRRERLRYLQALARRLADTAAKQKRLMALEPMPPADRRVIHVTLQDRDDVVSESIGGGRVKKIIIRPKEEELF